MKWGNPDFLPWVLFVIPLTWWIFRSLRRRESKLRELIAAEVWDKVIPEHAGLLMRRRAWLWIIAITLLLVAYARPQWGFRWEEVRRRGLDIIVVLDTSRSMTAPDFRPSRLQHAKWGIRDFVQKLKADRVGLVVFAGSAFLECPLTIDYAAFLMLLEDVYCGIIPKGGTAIEEGLRKAMAAFEQDTDSDKVILLVSDGEDHEGDPLKWIDPMQNQKIRVYAVGIGTVEGELLPAPREQEGTFLKDREGRVVKSTLNEDLLERLAVATGGMYVRATPGDFGSERIYEHTLNTLKRDEREAQWLKVHTDQHHWFLGAAFLLLAVEALLPQRRKNRGGTPP